MSVKPKTKINKVSCPFCKARFRWSHLCRAKNRRNMDVCITRDFVLKNKKSNTKSEVSKISLVSKISKLAKAPLSQETKNKMKEFEKITERYKNDDMEKAKRSKKIKRFLEKTLFKTRGSKSDGRKYKYFSPWDVAEQLNPALKEFYSYKESPERNTLAEILLGYHMLSYREFYRDFVKKLTNYLTTNKKKEEDFGDLDESVKLIVNDDEKTVLTITNHCAGGKWILIHQKKGRREGIHVRELHDKSDYPRSKYPEKLNLKFYKDRNFNMDYSERLHMTPLGGVYGDIRDNGYVISYEFYKIGDLDLGKDKDLTQISHFYNQWQNLTFLMRMILRDLKDLKEKIEENEKESK